MEERVNTNRKGVLSSHFRDRAPREIVSSHTRNCEIKWGEEGGGRVRRCVIGGVRLLGRLIRHWGGATFGSVGMVWVGATFGSAVRLLGRGGVCYYCMIIVYGQRAKLGGVLEKGSKGYNLALL